MRTARVDDHWRHLYEKKSGYRIDHVNFKSLNGLGTGEIAFSGGITALCGGNGVGKTTLLTAISSVLLSLESIKTKPTILKMGNADISGHIANGPEQFWRTVSVVEDKIFAEPEEGKVECSWIDTSTQAPKLVNVFNDMPNINEMLESEEPKVSTGEELKSLSYIIGKQYSRCLSYEIELDTHGIVPYFQVESEGLCYSSETMGLGELAVLLILWSFNRASKNSIVLVEEPETYLSPRSQELLLNVLAKTAFDKRLWVIITTHSPRVLKNIPNEHIRLLTPVKKTVDVITPTMDSEYLIYLGIRIHKTGVLFVEDRAAREYAKCWLGRYIPSLLQEFEIVDVGSREKIIEYVGTFPTIGKFKVVGLFDGDQRGKVTEKFKWPYSFLPGNDSIEEQFIELAKSNREELALLLGRDINIINITFVSLEGCDPHDWLIDFPRLIGVGYDQFIGFLFNLSMGDEGTKSFIDQSFEDLLAVLEPRTVA